MERFKKLISQMPVKEQAFTSKKDTWKNYYKKNPELNGLDSLVEKVFGDKETVEISRSDLFKLAENGNLEEFILSTIIWGYSSGMRGHHFQDLFRQRNKLKEHLEQLRKNKGHYIWNEHVNILNSIEGLGLSTYSKFLYFMKACINGYSALILDLKLIDVFSNRQENRLSFKENELDEYIGLKKIRYDNAPDKYPLYLKYMDTVAKENGVDSDQLEMFLFEFGSNLKA